MSPFPILQLWLYGQKANFDNGRNSEFTRRFTIDWTQDERHYGVFYHGQNLAKKRSLPSPDRKLFKWRHKELLNVEMVLQSQKILKT